MKTPLLLLTGLLLATGPARAAPEPSSARCAAGAPAGAQGWRGDVDGDGKVDRLWLEPPGSGSGDWVRDPWRERRRRFDPAALTLVLAHGGGAGAPPRCTLIQNRRFFATPIWEAADKPLQILPRHAPAAREWEARARRWRGDGVLLGSEAGVDVLLYWDGRHYRIAHAAEAP